MSIQCCPVIHHPQTAANRTYHQPLKRTWFPAMIILPFIHRPLFSHDQCLRKTKTVNWLTTWQDLDGVDHVIDKRLNKVIVGVNKGSKAMCNWQPPSPLNTPPPPYKANFQPGPNWHKSQVKLYSHAKMFYNKNARCYNVCSRWTICAVKMIAYHSVMDIIIGEKKLKDLVRKVHAEWVVCSLVTNKLCVYCEQNDVNHYLNSFLEINLQINQFKWNYESKQYIYKDFLFTVTRNILAMVQKMNEWDTG